MKLFVMLGLLLGTTLSTFSQESFPEFDIKQEAFKSSNDMMNVYEDGIRTGALSASDAKEAQGTISRGREALYHRYIKWFTDMRKFSASHWDTLSDYEKVECIDMAKGAYFGLDVCIRHIKNLGDIEPLPN
ncbi:MAG TPA: hypothetical protein VN715_07235 [Roseiarcus sp.]|nr:hypothetical protein [Roseiarcus sp.]